MDKLDESEERHYRELMQILDIHHDQNGEYYNWILNKRLTNVSLDGKLTGIDLSWLPLKKLPRNFLSKFKHLKLIRLDNNPHIEYEEGCFDGLPELQELQMQYCHLTTFPENTFTSKSMLKIIDISHNQFEVVNSGDFRHFPNIQCLDLSQTSITKLYPYSFEGLDNLKSLYLKNNHLTSLSANCFQGLSSLKELDISNNQISKVDVNSFRGLTKLEKLNMNSNDLQGLPSNLFKNTPDIERISLVNNKITSLDRIFCDLPSLSRIDLETNLLDRLRSYNFSNSPNLRHIQLQSNFITEIDPEVFTHLHNLEVINVEDNPLNGDQVLKLPVQALFNYHPMINNLTPDDIYKYIIKYYQNTRFVDQVLQSDKITDKTIAFLRLIGYKSPN